MKATTKLADFGGWEMPIEYPGGGAPRQEPRGVDLRCHIGQLPLYGLKLADGFAELLALF